MVVDHTEFLPSWLPSRDAAPHARWAPSGAGKPPTSFEAYSNVDSSSSLDPPRSRRGIPSSSYPWSSQDDHDEHRGGRNVSNGSRNALSGSPADDGVEADLAHDTPVRPAVLPPQAVPPTSPRHPTPSPRPNATRRRRTSLHVRTSSAPMPKSGRDLPPAPAHEGLSVSTALLPLTVARPPASLRVATNAGRTYHDELDHHVRERHDRHRRHFETHAQASGSSSKPVLSYPVRWWDEVMEPHLSPSQSSSPSSLVSKFSRPRTKATSTHSTEPTLRSRHPANVGGAHVAWRDAGPRDGMASQRVRERSSSSESDGSMHGDAGDEDPEGQLRRALSRMHRHGQALHTAAEGATASKPKPSPALHARTSCASLVAATPAPEREARVDAAPPPLETDEAHDAEIRRCAGAFVSSLADLLLGHDPPRPRRDAQAPRDSAVCHDDDGDASRGGGRRGDRVVGGRHVRLRPDGAAVRWIGPEAATFAMRARRAESLSALADASLASDDDAAQPPRAGWTTASSSSSSLRNRSASVDDGAAAHALGGLALTPASLGAEGEALRCRRRQRRRSGGGLPIGPRSTPHHPSGASTGKGQDATARTRAAERRERAAKQGGLFAEETDVDVDAAAADATLPRGVDAVVSAVRSLARVATSALANLAAGVAGVEAQLEAVDASAAACWCAPSGGAVAVQHGGGDAWDTWRDERLDDAPGRRRRGRQGSSSSSSAVEALDSLDPRLAPATVDMALFLQSDDEDRADDPAGRPNVYGVAAIERVDGAGSTDRGSPSAYRPTRSSWAHALSRRIHLAC